MIDTAWMRKPEAPHYSGAGRVSIAFLVLLINREIRSYGAKTGTIKTDISYVLV